MRKLHIASAAIQAFLEVLADRGVIIPSHYYADKEVDLTAES